MPCAPYVRRSMRWRPTRWRRLSSAAPSSRHSIDASAGREKHVTKCASTRQPRTTLASCVCTFVFCCSPMCLLCVCGPPRFLQCAIRLTVRASRQPVHTTLDSTQFHGPTGPAHALDFMPAELHKLSHTRNAARARKGRYCCPSTAGLRRISGVRFRAATLVFAQQFRDSFARSLQTAYKTAPRG